MTVLAEHEVVGDGPATLLFLHGLGGDWTNWKPQLDALGETHRCVSWTMPGYGDSPPMTTMTWETLADAATRVLDQVGAAEATVVGLSMGGMVAQQLAVSHPERVRKLALVATSPSFGRAGTDFADRYLAARYEPLDAGRTPADLAPSVVDGLLGPAAAPGVTENCVASMSRISSTAYRQALQCLVTWAFDDRLSDITAPTLCIAGADDQTAPVASLQRLADGISGATLQVIEQCGHLVNLEQPSAFNHALRAFVA